MAEYSYREARISGERKPRVNLCGSCGEECDSLLCDECVDEMSSPMGNVVMFTEWEPTDETERRTR